MKRLLIALSLILFNAQAHADVGVSVSIGEPGFYGRLDMGNFPQPQVIYSQPMAIEPLPMDRPPIYLRVPPGYAKHWGRHCHEYNACGERVYFVNDNWYQREYAPRYREQYRRDDRHHDREDHRRDERGDDHYRGDDRGEGGRGRGDDRGRDH